ncbi:xanthine dehydrogenase accessory protein XdhC [Cocleimonas sp. KMM 6892]|uniref:xanthine dehydrogenase accessory protein XdhC n=1 Tax=unclassified Cocleimonas TaxID=2639732 RepID=UPI002DB81524|nr:MULTISPECIES: xanthine dehydrogenase accessory protein XdhC [unclassified Cocleimonas]MEB8431736.1 xanthine dehydrogenase accessory protein XdhC [Cocleimonas sp. KMM 6892]MEC4715178.1 xanthine dehydrogenase accessory protein XdhC [Cocleimonas sp. KMM 6895]MEC4744008.1 xanthine dehydrogenase accessory protein XdhC [Cocleimonas sp. KMM 6896]
MNWVQAMAKLESEAQGFVLLTVMAVRGSSPRDTGTKMVVSEGETYDTIGGGALEFQSIDIARELLKSNKLQQHTERFNLGKDLKQCCGGVVSVFFEVFPASDFVLNIFGAGHIGQALVKILAEVDCKVNLFDSRPELLSGIDARNVQTIHLKQPELAVESCPENSYFLVMTHDHALDQQLCEAILTRGDAVYCGVIGSSTKGLKFRQRLLKKGFNQDELQQLTCPMGLPDLKTKKPMEIAVSIMAECLLLKEKQQLDYARLEDDINKIVSIESRD